MCGIVGLLSYGAGTVDRTVLERMRDAMAHRGRMVPTPGYPRIARSASVTAVSRLSILPRGDAADAQRGWRRRHHLQRRNLQSREAAARTGRPGASVSYRPQRYRGAGSRIRGVGAGRPARAHRRRLCLRNLDERNGTLSSRATGSASSRCTSPISRAALRSLPR